MKSVFLKVYIPDFLYKKLLTKKGYVICPKCKHLTHPNNYCEFCGSKMAK